jgi:DNA-directed RNA polymerase subunit RPC12/RpoP
MITPFKVEWIDLGRAPQCPPNPNYPEGRHMDVRSNRDAPSCTADLPYPAARCGHYVVECSRCGLRILLTTAGRPDDPRSVRMTCKMS